MQHEDFSWKEFERFVESVFEDTLDKKKWRIKTNWRRSYGREGDNTTYVIMDIHVAERRQGGCGFVVDAKHFKVNPLPTHEIDTTLNYKKLCKASKAIVITSSTTKIPPATSRYAEKNNVELLVADHDFEYNLRELFNSFLDSNRVPVEAQDGVYAIN